MDLPYFTSYLELLDGKRNGRALCCLGGLDQGFKSEALWFLTQKDKRVGGNIFPNILKEMQLWG